MSSLRRRLDGVGATVGAIVANDGITRMRGQPPPVGPAYRLRPALLRTVGTWLGAALLGMAIAIVYGSSEMWQLAHSPTPWITFGVFVGLGRNLRGAILLTCSAFLVAVTSFYGIRDLVIGGSSLNLAQLAVWWLIAIAAGAALGGAASALSRDDRTSMIAAGILTGLVISDTYIRTTHYGDRLNAAVQFDVIVLSILLVYLYAHGGRLVSVMLVAAPTAIIGLYLLSLPDLLEQLVIVGVVPPAVP